MVDFVKAAKNAIAGQLAVRQLLRSVIEIGVFSQEIQPASQATKAFTKLFKLKKPSQRLTYAKVAEYIESGYTISHLGEPKYVPARNFTKRTIAKLSKETFDFSKDPQEVLHDIGKRGVEIMKEYIKGGNFEPNTPLTASLKGSTKPLIDTGGLLSKVEYRIKEDKDG